MKFWLVDCRVCGSATTVARPPGSVDFVKDVQCVLCGRKLDANRGVFRSGNTTPKDEEKPDLLEVK